MIGKRFRSLPFIFANDNYTLRLPVFYMRFSFTLYDFGAKSPNYDACGLFRASYSCNPPRYEQAHVDLDILILVSLYKTVIK